MRLDSPLGRIAAPIVIALIGIAVGAVISIALPGYFVFLGTSAIVAAIALLGLGVVTGSAGMIALCQLSFAAIGAWIVSGLNLINAPGGPLVWLIIGALAAALAGIAIGLPALRLRGVNLAVVTLGFAAAIAATLQHIQFPGSATYVRVLAPEAFSTDRSFFFLSVIVLAISAVGVQLLRNSRIGSGWRFVAFSERALASAGGSVRTTKLSAFAVSALLGGLSGGLVVEQVGIASPATFDPLQSLALYVLAIVSGSHLVDMAIFGGILWVGIPEILRRLNIPQDWGLVLFGVLGIQALTSRSNLGQNIRNLIERRRGAAKPGARLVEAAQRDAAAGPPRPAERGQLLLDVRDLAVQFGTVKALDGVALQIHEGDVLGLIGPNGAGKSTLIDAVSGFLPQHHGHVTIGTTAVSRSSPTALARRGLRRTFQQDRVPPSLTVEAYIRFVARRRLTNTEIDDVLDFFGCPPRRTPLAAVDVGTRRLVEFAGQLAAKPQVLLLDETAAGLSHEEHLALADRLQRVPARFGVALLLIEHDLDLIRQVSTSVTVLDFGRVLASGQRDQVLADPAVIRAYMGETEML